MKIGLWKVELGVDHYNHLGGRGAWCKTEKKNLFGGSQKKDPSKGPPKRKKITFGQFNPENFFLRFPCKNPSKEPLKNKNFGPKCLSLLRSTNPITLLERDSSKHSLIFIDTPVVI